MTATRSVGFRLPISTYHKLDKIRERRGLKTMSPILIEACAVYADMHYTPDEDTISIVEAKEEILKMIKTDPEFRAELLQELIYELEHPPEKAGLSDTDNRTDHRT
ncbi:hypothetical protein [Methanogenium cariaci]|jgi:hypothetical protein